MFDSAAGISQVQYAQSSAMQREAEMRNKLATAGAQDQTNITTSASAPGYFTPQTQSASASSQTGDSRQNSVASAPVSVSYSKENSAAPSISSYNQQTQSSSASAPASNPRENAVASAPASSTAAQKNDDGKERMGKRREALNKAKAAKEALHGASRTVRREAGDAVRQERTDFRANRDERRAT